MSRREMCHKRREIPSYLTVFLSVIPCGGILEKFDAERGTWSGPKDSDASFETKLVFEQAWFNLVIGKTGKYFCITIFFKMIFRPSSLSVKKNHRLKCMIFFSRGRPCTTTSRFLEWAGWKPLKTLSSSVLIIRLNRDFISLSVEKQKPGLTPWLANTIMTHCLSPPGFEHSTKKPSKMDSRWKMSRMTTRGKTQG